jgi:hypothetical protein
MKNILLLIFAIGCVSTAQAAPLSAIMTFESMTLTADGVRKQTQFQERFIRDTNMIWSERILPSAVHQHNHDEKNEQEHHHDLNFATAGKWISRTENNQLNFAFVREHEKKIIQPRASEYGMLGFHGEWETAYYLVDRLALKKMTVTKRGPTDTTQWYEKKDATQLTRVLWDERKEIPLSIETSRLDGTMSNKITLVTTAVPAILPWNNLKDYQIQAYEDLLD